jgi:hypothetical protein
MMTGNSFNSNVISCGTASEVKKLKCPECGAGLKVSYCSNDKVKSARAKCLSCNFIVHHCRLGKEPPWVSELGNEFETS